MKRFILCAAVSLGIASWCYGQGSLTPPAPPGPTMKSLDQIEPGTPIDHVPYTISAPGRYYLTRNVSVPDGSDGITVSADNVTIDLRGFTISGIGGSGSAIVTPAAQKNLAVFNGTLRGCIRGLSALNTTNSIVEHLRVTDCGVSAKSGVYSDDDGIDIGDGALVRACVTGNNVGHAIRVGNRAAVIDCTSSGDQSFGIQTGDDCTVSRCTVAGSSGTGVHTGAGCTVESCTTNANTAGVAAGPGSVVRNCTTRGNGTGVYVYTGGSQVVGNTCDLNSLYGIHVEGDICRIEANSCSSNAGYGVYAPGHHNLVIRNNFSNNSLGPWNLAADTVFGALVTSSGGQIPDNVGANANFSH